MPKIVDHDQRRRELARAVWSVVRREGLGAASVRAVAREAGWSPSSVQYYFATQDELLTFAMRMTVDGAEERLRNEEGMPEDPRALVFALVERLLPVDSDARVAAELWVAFLSRVLVDAEARAFNTATASDTSELFAGLVGGLRDAGMTSAQIDVDLETDRLHALFDGLSVQVATEPERMTPERARAVVVAHIDSVLLPEHRGTWHDPPR
ncbi:TetR/AcrR family transcriptional regulator [Allokutzneria sp. A3M-2-11 16]|uniref:TetR/AcrR family transcriptional regulator n=1 Tax=Allokutzneria sp. A3M-2-11 16 TaxID=2962043 RepID=UPI0020B6C7E7|nr:TetR/AcrR family transcriptional regulator [Allokutzneria sp. A3M-2-11 16]MCP3801680.1 TetR/AcrR family transcriptional regulator [Allokutzneria sp. A3M-2-11 16]